MDLTQISQATPQPTLRTPTDDGVLTSDFQAFLQLLTAQMQNQDPLNPMESTEYATQLATFSGVEQQVRTNDLLSDLGRELTQLGLGQMGGWLGMVAQTEGPVTFTGTPLTLQAEPAARADRAELVVRSLDGQLMHRSPIPLSEAPFPWDGRDTSGTMLPDGTYSVRVESFAGEFSLGEAPTRLHAVINEAELINGETWFTLDGGTRVPSDAVHALGRPGSQ